MPNVIDGILASYDNFDLNVDGDASIKSLKLAAFETPGEAIPHTGRLVLVLVEARLLAPLAGGMDLTSRLVRLKGDLRAEGLFTRFIVVDLYAGPRHQDGRTLLAIRTFLAQAKALAPNLEGALMIGSFPEATVVRRCIWRPSFDVVIDGKKYTKTPYLAIEPEMVAARTEIVLADLNGTWENLYHEDLTPIESIRALPDAATGATAWPVDGAVFSSTAFDRTEVSYRDFFFVDDADYTDVPAPQGEMRLLIRHALLNPELTAADRALVNPLARPDVLISRINARSVAVNPKPSIVGDDGKKPLASDGKPQAFSSSTRYDTWMGFFSQDPVLERRVLCDYLDRNHRYRIGAFADRPFRAAGIGYKFSGTGAAGYLAPASTDFTAPLVQNTASLLDYVRWLEKPAALRCIQAHSSKFSSQFGSSYNTQDLENEVGGRPFRWKRSGSTYEPSLADQGADADFYVHRSLWQNGELDDAGPSLLVHGGCEVNVPSGTQAVQHYVEGYAGWQNAEGLLFFGNTLALIARAKVFNDLPTGFPGALSLSSRARFGDGWGAFFDNDSADAYLGSFEGAIRSKKAYFWSMLGDWSVRLRYSGGLGIVALDRALQAAHVHPDEAWMEGWNFDSSVNVVRGIGDFDGDGRSEFVITSGWGIGILKHDGDRWRQVLVAPNDTWFGGWRYMASVNVGHDQFQGFTNMTAGGADEIVLTSSWGVGVLALVGDTLTSPIVRPNGTRFGGWLFDSRANQFAGFGDVDGDGLDEAVIVSDWGIGILKAKGSTFDSLMLAPNGTRFGGWLFNSRENTIHRLADFDGDGEAEILVTSPWGIGVLKVQGRSLTSVAIHANGTNLGGYVLDTSAGTVAAIGDLAGDGHARILISDAAGLHLLRLVGGSLHREAFWANGSRSDGWLLNTADNTLGPVGDLDSDGMDEVVVRSPWGIGVLGLRGGTLACQALAAHGSHLGEWILRGRDRVAGIGNLAGPGNRQELLVQAGT